MVKTVTLRCENCGEKITFKIGADASLSTFANALAAVADRKEAERINDLFLKISAGKNAKESCEFGFNAAEPLNTVVYGTCGEECMQLIESLPDENASAIFSEKVMACADGSTAKWNSALNRDCFTAFNAIYICPKTRRPMQGVHLALHYRDGKTLRHYAAANRCGECSAKTILADDGNCGFMHDGCPTAARCPKCKGRYVIDSISFKIE